jgi:hypothetical protein
MLLLSFLIKILIIGLILYFSFEVYNFLKQSFVRREGFEGMLTTSSEITSQVNKILTTIKSLGAAQRVPTIFTSPFSSNQDCLINYQVLGVRMTGFLGPFDNGFFHPQEAVRIASEVGARLFVLDIDYIDSCFNRSGKYFPRLVVRDIKNRNRIEEKTNSPQCQSQQTSNIRQTAQAIKDFALSPLNPQNQEPVILVLNFLRIPPGGRKSSHVLDYYSAVAQALEPLYQDMLHNEPSGNYSRQKLEGNILTAPLEQFSGKVIIATNTDLTGFRDDSVSYSSKADLDYLTNLSLFYNQSREGATQQAQGQVFGILEKVEDFQIIPEDRIDNQIEKSKLRFTVLLPSDPNKSVTEEQYSKAMNLGVNCIPMAIWDTKDALKLFYTQSRFYNSSWKAKPENIRYNKPQPIYPATPSPQLNSNGGFLRAPQ